MIEIRKVNPMVEKKLIDSGFSPLLARIFAGRNVVSAEEINLNLSSLPHFSLFKNMTAVAQFLANAILSKNKIVIAGDYDADGATSCVVALRSIRAMGGLADFVVPDRQKEGYGLSKSVVDRAIEKGADVIVTVDNGIAAVESIHYAQAKNVNVIVTDHHLPGKELPNCLIVNPNQAGCAFPSKHLAGVGVIFYVMLAVRNELEKLNYFHQSCPKPNMAEFLDFVALGTVADVVQLDHTNRILVNYGLKLIKANKTHYGIQALFDVAKKSIVEAKTYDLGFTLGPRINAAGRLDDISTSIKCLMADSYQEACHYAQKLNDLNQQRKKTERAMLALSEEQLGCFLSQEQKTIVIYSDTFHQGVIGIIAGRLKDKYHLPSIVFAKAEGEEIKGSARSIRGFHIRDALDLLAKKNPGLIDKFGGHAMAAGLSINIHRFELFKKAFEALAQETLESRFLKKHCLTDGNLDSKYMNLETAKQLSDMVWGQGFEEPIFVDRFEIVQQSQIGSYQSHLKVIVKKEEQYFEALLFSCQAKLPKYVNFVYRLIANQWNDREELQLYVDHWDKSLDVHEKNIL